MRTFKKQINQAPPTKKPQINKHKNIIKESLNVHTLVQFVPNSNVAIQRAQQPKMQVQAVLQIPMLPYITISNCIF